MNDMPVWSELPNNSWWLDSPPLSEVELRSDLVQAWTKYAKLHRTVVPQELRSQIRVHFITDGGKVNFTHGKRAFAVGTALAEIPSYATSVTCKSHLIEHRYYEIPSDDDHENVGIMTTRDLAIDQLCIAYASMTFDAIQHPNVLQEFAVFEPDYIQIITTGLDQKRYDPYYTTTLAIAIARRVRV
jgi:hypothetical protein